MGKVVHKLKPRIFASFSMGKSSAVMCKIIKEKYSKTHEVIFGCANTTEELQESIEFGQKVDEFLGLNCVLVEAIVHPKKGDGTTHKLTTWKDARMKGEAFKDVVAKFGIPNMKWLHCTRELKTNPMTSYLRSIGWEAGSYDTAIGYRADEIDRVPAKYKEKRQIYPLINAGITKEDVYKEFASNWPFTLNIKEHEGNCKSCHKKNDRKLLTLMRDHPERFATFEKLEKKFAYIGAEFLKNPQSPPRRFFRQNRTVADLRKLSKQDFEKFEDELYQEHFGECAESCEPFMEAPNEP